MGKLNRRVKFIAKERRLSIPAEFLHEHSIQRGDAIHLAARGNTLFAFPARSWEGYQGLARQLGRWFPDDRHPFFALFEDAARVTLGSQDRVVLPRDFPFHPKETIRLHWEMVDGFLHLEAENGREPEAPPLARGPGQTSLMDFLPTPAPSPAARPTFDRRAAERSLTQRVPIEAVDFRDRTFAEKSPIPTDSLVRSVRLEGIRRPLVLLARGDDTYQVIDGFRRLAAARQLKIAQVPAVVWRDLDFDACMRLKLLETTEEASEAPTLRRLRSTLKLHEGQVDLQEIEKITGRRKRTLQRYLRVAADPLLREAIEKGRLSIFKAEEILKAGVDPETALRKRMTVKEIRAQSHRPAPSRRARRRAATPRRRGGRGTPTVPG